MSATDLTTKETTLRGRRDVDHGHDDDQVDQRVLDERDQCDIRHGGKDPGDGDGQGQLARAVAAADEVRGRDEPMAVTHRPEARAQSGCSPSIAP